MAQNAPAPPGPRGDFLLGSTLDFKENPMHYLRYVHTAYGDVARFWVGTGYWYLVAHPEDISDAMRARKHLFLKPQIAKRLWDKFLGDGLLTTEGAVWKRLNKMVRPAFHAKRIRAYGDTFVAYTHRMIDQFTDGEDRDLSEDMVSLTLQVVAKTLFDADVGSGTSKVGDAMHVLNTEMLEHIYSPLPVPRWWPSARNKRKLAAIADTEEIVKDVIEDRRQTGEDRGDLLSMLVFARDEAGQGLTDREIRDQAMTLFFAGHETTAHQMTWAWYLLANHPEITARLQGDIDRVAPGRSLTVEDLASLPYLEWCVKEAMRILPSVWVFMKEPTEDVVVRGFRIPKGAPVLFSAWVTHHDPRWFPRPETFDPERFSPGRVETIPKGAWIPFSGGQRECLGKAFAMMEAKLILGTMLQRLTPQITPGFVPEKHAALSMHPKNGLSVSVRFRTEPAHPAG